MELFDNGTWLPLAFAGLMWLATYVYTVLDGYDIGVGILMNDADEPQRDVMISSIGPFWDANETWLVLAVGLLLVAFPYAQGIILTNLYLPIAFMLFGLILRGVSFDFRAKAKSEHKQTWDNAFIFGSTLMAFSQGYMLGKYLLGFMEGAAAMAFCATVGLAAIASYVLMGASWLMMKSSGALQKRAIKWAIMSLYGTAFGILLISITLPLMSERVFERWFAGDNFLYLMPIPLFSVLLVGYLRFLLYSRIEDICRRKCWIPFACTAALFLLSFIGIGYSFYPYIVPEQLTIAEAAAAPESLMFILIGALVVLPFLIGYTIFSYRVFHGKTVETLY
jgi:cytochrome d ubiquinol oxidase subunit II